MNDVLPPRGHLPGPKAPQRPQTISRQPAAGTRPVPPQPRVSGSPTTPPSKNMVPPRALELPPAIPPDKPMLKKTKKRWLAWLVGIFVSLILLAAIGGTAAYIWYKDALGARSASDERIKIQVESGAGAGQVAGLLEQKGIIKSGLALQIYMKLHGKNEIKAGSYVFMPSQTPYEIVEWLIAGKVDAIKVTILPGKTLADIKATFVKAGYGAEDVDKAFAETYDHPLFDGKPGGTSLEGYIYPETYFATSDTPLRQLLVQGFDLFDKRINEKNLRQALSQRNLTLYQGITLASMIEKEVHNAADKRQVAQVFLKRLGEGAKLASDPTYKYAAALLGVSPNSSIDSPYNTYKYAGLPVGPIANFTLDSLEAVVNPAPGDYLYFVAGDDGTTHFSLTFEEHERNIRDYCKQLCSQF